LNIATTLRKPPAMREQVYEILRTALADGGLKPGTPIALDEIAARLEVSRTPVREALLRLETEGFVTIRPRSGISVRVLTREDIRNLYQMIGALEASVLVAESHLLTPGKIAAMRAQNEACRAALERDDFDAYYEANLAMHGGYLELSANRELVHHVTVMKQRLYDFPRKGAFVKEWELTSTDEHEEIIAHLEAGDFAWAAEVVRDVHWSYAVQEKWIELYYGDEIAEGS
jgi:DNA-binding GntR family transcriptional regulator